MRLNWLMLFLVIPLLFWNCSDDKEPVPEPTPEEGNMVDMIQALEKRDDLSVFTNLLKGSVSTSDWENKEFTLFAFKNYVARATMPDPSLGILVQRHMVEGKLSLSDLKAKESLITVNNITLTVETDGEAIFINGEKLGPAITTDGAVTYPVDQSFPENYPVYTDKEITFRVLRCNPDYSSDPSWMYEPAVDVSIIFYDEEMNEISMLVTDASGAAVLKVLDKSIGGYIVSDEDGYSNLWNDLLIEGVIVSEAEVNAAPFYGEEIFEKKVGNLKLKDSNGDGWVDYSDEVQYAWLNMDQDEIFVFIGRYSPFTTSPGYHVTEKELEAAVLSCENYWCELYGSYAEMNRELATEAQRQQIDSSDRRVNRFWEDAYRLIRNTNMVLSKDIIDEDLYSKRYDLFMRATSIRAFTYHYLSVLFGGVPLVLEPVYPGERIFRNTVKEVNEFVKGSAFVLDGLEKDKDTAYFKEWMAIFLYHAEYIQVKTMFEWFQGRGEVSALELLYVGEADILQNNWLEATRRLNEAAVMLGQEIKLGTTPLPSELVEFSRALYGVCDASLPFFNSLRWGDTGNWEKQFRVVLPIPHNEMATNPDMTQNPGW